MIQQTTKKYTIENESGVFIPEDRSNYYTYSDGEDFEKNLLKVIQQAKDLSLGSIELNKYIIDSPSRYHLSPQRVDLLRPLQDLLKGDVLEIGSGCGAITGYIAEKSKKVIAVEGELTRAVITAARCRDRKNVSVYCDNFLEFDIPQKFDVVTLIGVLEYARLYGTSNDPVLEMLEKAKSYLKPDGILIIAIENQLGLKYFAGAPEDHLGVPYAGIENKYSEKGPVTFGKKILTTKLLKAEYATVEFLYPFPDYKYPLAIISEYAEKNKSVNIADIIKFRSYNEYNDSYKRTINTEKVIPILVENELMGDLSNSFLVVAGISNNKSLDSNLIAYTFSNYRKKEFCKINKIFNHNKSCLVKREKTYPKAINKSDIVKQDLNDEKYLSGSLLVNGLINIAAFPGWHIEEILEWAKPWTDYLSSKSIGFTEEGIPLVHGKYFDASPFNMIINENSIESFDLEWVVQENLSIDYIIYRGLYYSFCLAPIVPESATKVYTDLAEICNDIVQVLFPRAIIKTELYELLERKVLTELIEKLPEKLFFKDIAPKPIAVETVNENTTHEILTPFSEFAVQFFWANQLSGFSEENSSKQVVNVSNGSVLLTFKIPPITEQVNYIRFDIGDKCGLLNIHLIQIKNQDGGIIWQWDLYTILQQQSVILIEDRSKWPEKVLQFSTSIDPWFIFEATDSIKALTSKGFVLEILVSAPDKQQIDFIYSNTAPLSYINHKQLLQFEQHISQLNMEKLEIQDEIKNHLQTISNLNENIHLFKQNQELSQHLVTQLSSDKLELVKDKSILTNELSQLQTIITKIQDEKIICTQQLLQSENNLIAINKTILELQTALSAQTEKNNQLSIDRERGEQKIIQLENSLTLSAGKVQELETILAVKTENFTQLMAEREREQQRLIILETALAELNHTTSELRGTLALEIEKKNQIIAEKQNITVEKERVSLAIIELDKTLQQHLTQKNELINTITSQLSYIHQISNETTELKGKKEELANKLGQIKKENNLLKIELDENATKINALQNIIAELNKKNTDYENQSLYRFIAKKLKKGNK